MILSLSPHNWAIARPSNSWRPSDSRRWRSFACATSRGDERRANTGRRGRNRSVYLKSFRIPQMAKNHIYIYIDYVDIYIYNPCIYIYNLCTYIYIYKSYTYIDYIYKHLWGWTKILTTHILGKNAGKSLHFDFFCDWGILVLGGHMVSTGGDSNQ